MATISRAQHFLSKHSEVSLNIYYVIINHMEKMLVFTEIMLPKNNSRGQSVKYLNLSNYPLSREKFYTKPIIAFKNPIGIFHDLILFNKNY